MSRAGLIGHTGFVGGNLLRSHRWDSCYNSANIAEIDGSFDLLVCAGVSAVKWLANQQPEADRAAIARLTDALAKVHAREVVLISTIDVYPYPEAGGTEDTAIDPRANHHAYGRHRLALEHWMRDRFACTRVVRLPALFGPGLRKNLIYDLLHETMVDKVNPAGVFQWYPVTRLWNDIGTVRQAGLDLVNLCPEPLATRRILDALFPAAQVGPAVLPPPKYDIQTRHAALFDGPPGYCMTADAAFWSLDAFVAGARVA